MMMKAFDWFVVMCVVAVIIVCSCVLIAIGQTYNPQDDVSTTTTPAYEYDGWQHKTTLRSNTWDAGKRPPQPNERLYIYKDGAKQQEYYEWNGYDWDARDGAYFNNNEQ